MTDDILKLNEEEKPFDAPPGGKKEKAPPARDAATLLLIRNGREVMMGQRAKGHVFMPDKWVFPGGRVDPGDARRRAAAELTADNEAFLRLANTRRPPRALALAAARETLEETGLKLGGPAGPDLSKLTFIARAITPPHRPRRFDARFFMADAAQVLASDIPVGGDELLHVEWFPFEETEKLDLPSITRFVLKEAGRRLAGEAVDPPFLRWKQGGQHIERLTLGSGG
jgi:8-oxo-dGTP pyrophosphatase MutT (NUDIX family)